MTIKKIVAALAFIAVIQPVSASDRDNESTDISVHMNSSFKINNEIETLYNDDIDEQLDFNKIKLCSDIEDLKWDYLPLKIDLLDLSDINILSKVAILALSKREIEILNLSKLGLTDDDLEELKEIKVKSLDISSNPIGGFGLRFLSKNVKELYLNDTLVSSLAVKENLKGREVKIIID